jgi:Fe-S-cluster containining protein
LTWECKGCSECCKCRGSLAYVVFEPEFRDELRAAVDAMPEEARANYALIPGPGGKLLLALHRTGTPCVFLSQGRCSIWERRPVACVELPQAYIGKMSEHQLAERAKICPGMKGFLDGR